MAQDSDIQPIADGIAGIESGGNYGVTGPVTKSGDRAYGKYQIMGANIPAWTEEAGVGRMSPEQFLANSDAQEKTARHRLGKYYDQYGNALDVASMWHSGVPYQQAVDEGRADQLGTTTQSYADRVAQGSSSGQSVAPPPATSTAPDTSLPPEPADIDYGPSNVPQEPDYSGHTMVALPDGRYFDLGTNPTPEYKRQVHDALAQKFPDMMKPRAAAPETPFRDKNVDDVGRAWNQAMGNDSEDWKGHLAANVSKPVLDAIDDVSKVFALNPNSTGNPLELATWKDALDRSLKILHPLGIVGEAAGNVVMQAANAAGLDPRVSQFLAFGASMAGGYFTPIPGLRAAPGETMPLQGTAATRAAAAETGAAATQAETAAAAATRESEAVGARGTQWSEAQAQQSAADTASAQAQAQTAQQAADEAAAKVTPSPEAATRATEALAPGGTTSQAGSRAATGALETKLNEVRDPVKGIYDALVSGAEDEGKTLTPEQGQKLLDQIDAIKEELGPTLSGQAKSVLSNVEDTITSGKPVGPKLLDDYRQQLDTLFPGRTPRTATPKQSALYQFKWDVRDVARSMYGEDEQKWAEAADALYRDTIVGKDNPTALGPLTALAKKNPDTFVERVFGNGTTDKQGVYANAVMKHLDPADATDLRRAILARGIDKATNKTTGTLDPAALLKHVDGFSGSFRSAVLDDVQETFLRTLAKEQTDAPVAAAAAKAAQRTAAETTKAGESAVAAAERTADVGAKVAEKDASRLASDATAAREAATTAAQAATKPSKLARVVAGGIELGATKAMKSMGFELHPSMWEIGGYLLGNDLIAKAIANSKTANLLTRALRTGLDSPAAVTVMEELKNRDRDTNFLSRR